MPLLSVRLLRARHAIVLSAIAVLAFTMPGCGSEQSSAPPAPAPPASNRPGKSTGKPIDLATAGFVTGTIRLDGAPPPMKPISMAAVPNCARQHPTPAMTEDVVPGDNGTLQNVVVYLKGDLNRYSFDAPAAPVTIDQKGCVYSPHVVALITGQPLRILNSDAVTHNIHAFPNANPEWNQSQSPGAVPIEQIFTREEITVPLKCNMHAFMRAFVAVLGNPYFQVTAKDGSFTMKNVPPGTYTVAAWHELYGTSEQSVTIRPREAKTIAITFKATAATN